MWWYTEGEIVVAHGRLPSPARTECSQNINKQIVKIADENLTDYSFLSRYQYLIKELFEKTISNSSLNSHVYWDHTVPIPVI